MNRVPSPLAPRVSVVRWNCLVGFSVEVVRRGHVVGGGIVEAASPNSDYVWLAGYGVDSRRLIHRAEGYELLVDEEQARILNGPA